MPLSRRTEKCANDYGRAFEKSGMPVKGVDAKPGTEWLKPGLIGCVRHLKGVRRSFDMRLCGGECESLLTVRYVPSTDSRPSAKRTFTQSLNSVLAATHPGREARPH